MIEIDNPDFLAFISAHRNDSPAELMLKYNRASLSFDLINAVTQIDCRRRTAVKLKSFNTCDRFYYPSRIAAEQSSNEEVARYHASLIGEGESVADLTAGLGIDAMTVASRAASVTTFEIDADKTEALRHNAKAMGITNIMVNSPGDSIAHLRQSAERFDVIFIDPARRDDADHRMYGLQDCTPDVKEWLPLLMEHCQRLIIKASPMLDMTQTVRDLPGLKMLQAVSWRGECKEILAIVENGWTGQCEWSAVMIDSKGNTTSYIPKENVNVYSPVPEEIRGCYLYEPDAAVLKLGKKARLDTSFTGLAQCDTNTQIYISPILHTDFPGRILKIEDIHSLGDKSLKRLKGEKRNIVCRNFPLKPEELKKRLKLKDGGNDFLYGLTIAGQHRLLLAPPINLISP